MKRLLIFIACLISLSATAQDQPLTLRKTPAGGFYSITPSAVRDTFLTFTGAFTNGYIPMYNSTLKKLYMVNPTSFAPSISFASFGSTPNANGASISAGVITLQPASATHPGGMSTGAQAFTGTKSFSVITTNDIQANNNNTNDIGTSGGNIFRKLWINDVNINSLSASRALVSDGSKNVSSSATTATEIGYVSGVTSSIQTQLNSKSGLASFSATTPITYNNGTGVFSIADGAISNAKLANSTISGIALGSNLPALTFGTYLTGTSYNGSTGTALGVTASTTGGASSLVATDASSNITGSSIIANGSSIFTATNQASAAVYGRLANTVGSFLWGVYNDSGTGFGSTAISGMTANATGVGTITATPFQIFTDGIVRQTTGSTGATNFTGAISASNLSGTNTGDNATNSTSNAYADAKVVDNLTASTTIAPSKSAVNTGLALKANLASPTFTGTPSLPTGTTGITQTAGDNSTKLATTAYVDAATGGSNVDGGSYVPVVYGVSNIASSEGRYCTWTYVNGVVTVQGSIGIDPTSSGVDTIIDIQLAPGYASDFTGSADLNGDGGSLTTNVVIYANTTNDRAQVYLIPGSVDNQVYRFSFSYIAGSL